MDYLNLNRQAWNYKVRPHLSSSFYDVEGFLNGKSTLNEIELKLLGNVENKTILHLQCHFGLDTISLSRMGAKSIGIDFSDQAIFHARKLSKKVQSSTTFICCDVYDTPANFDQKVDIIFTSYGAIGWLPELDTWAKVISTLLKPAGILVLVEFHPFLWMFDDTFSSIKYRYFNSGPIIEVETGTYADKNSKIEHSTVTWNHSISEVISSLFKYGIKLTSFLEYDYSPYNCFNNTIEIESGKFQIKHLSDKIPMVYSIVAKKI